MGNKNRNDHVLSQAEIDALLTAISAGPVEDDSASYNHHKKIKIYDFKRPDIFSREQLRTISNSFDLFAKAYAKFLNNYTKTNKCDIHVASVDQLTFEEFTRSIPSPTEANISQVTIDKSVFAMITEVNPSISFKLLNLPVDPKKACKNRDLTDGEIDRWEKEIVAPTLDILKKTFRMAFDSNVRSIKNAKTETNPTHFDCIRPESMVCLVTLEVAVDGEEGMINICLPHNLAHKLCNDYNGIVDPDTTQFNVDKFRNLVKVNLKASLGNASMPIKDVENLGEGSIIELDKLAGEPVDIEIDGKVFAKGEVVVIDETFGVRLVEMI